MWVLDYYFSLWNYLKGNNVEGVYEPLKVLSDSEKTKVIQLFENTIDQNSFNTADYQRLRSFLIDWYTPFRTLTTTQSNVSDAFSLPDADLDELFRSFGYPYSQPLSLLNNEVNPNKVHFFLDLVNLYKIKGTPESILKVFTYYGIKRAEIYEYFVKRDPSNPTNHLVFVGDKVAYSGHEITLPQTSKMYLPVTQGDPHWFYTEEKLLEAIDNTKIQLPSKSPYFSLRIYYDMVTTQATAALISRKITDDYNSWLATSQKPPQTAYITRLGINISFLELYLLVIYLFNYRTKPRPTIPERYSYYTPSPADDYQTILDDYVTLHNNGTFYYVDPITGEVEERPLNRQAREEKLEQWYQDFSQPFPLSFLKTPEEVAAVFENINPELKYKIDEIRDLQPFAELFGPYIQDLQIWISSYIGGSISNLSYLILGEEEIERNLGSIINFFKPYHARLMSVDMALSTKDRLTDSILLDDGLFERIEENTWDYITCDSEPCCLPNDSCSDCGDYDDNVYVDAELRSKRHYSRATYDCGSFYDIGAVCDTKPDFSKVIFFDKYIDKLTCRNALFTEEPYREISFIQNVNTGQWNTIWTPIIPPPRILSDEFTETVNYSNPLEGYDTSSQYTITSGGFTDFDFGGCFDSPYASDICEVVVIDH